MMKPSAVSYPAFKSSPTVSGPCKCTMARQQLDASKGSWSASEVSTCRTQYLNRLVVIGAPALTRHNAGGLSAPLDPGHPTTGSSHKGTDTQTRGGSTCNEIRVSQCKHLGGAECTKFLPAKKRVHSTDAAVQPEEMSSCDCGCGKAHVQAVIMVRF